MPAKIQDIQAELSALEAQLQLIDIAELERQHTEAQSNKAAYTPPRA